MKRPLGGAGTRRLVSRIRERVPGVVFRTTLIVGAPGEGEAEFRELLDFVEESRFERLGVFRYSREPDTPLGRAPDQVPQDVAEARWHEIMAAQQAIAFADGRAQVDRTLASIVETTPEGGTARGRTWRDAPEIDGEIVIRGAPGLGAIGDVRVTSADGYDLEGVWIG
jgi:ribosomal protein S12 methylthiotransferase